MRKTIAGMLSALLIVGSLGVMPALATDQPAATSESGVLPEVVAPVFEDPVGLQPGTELIVGTTTRLSGDFSTDMWGTNTADMDVRALLHAYETVSWTRVGSMQFNGTVVKDAFYEARGGEHLYNIEIYDDLKYNDGSAITAADYVFAMLLSCAPQIAEIGGTPQGLNHLRGHDEYQSGATNIFSGIRLISDTQFQLSILGEYLPFFYGVALLQVQPYPISAIAPGCEVRDDGQGAYIAAKADAAGIQADGYTAGEFSAAMLRETLLNPETGYLNNPRVTSGPYSLESYDAENSVAKFVVNPNFKGNVLGQKPHIERLELRYVDEEESLTLLEEGELGLINKMINDMVVIPALEKVGIEEIRMASYPRSGLAFLAFSCEEEPTDSLAVRRAIALALDKDAIVENSQQTATATRVEGYYGLGQWMVSYSDGGAPVDESAGGDAAAQPAQSEAATPDEEILSIPEKLDALRTSVDIAGAQALLERDGWALNEAGEAFNAERDVLRYREKDGELQPLTLKLVIAENMVSANTVRAELEATLPRLGIGLEVAVLPFPELLQHYYRQTERVYNMFFMGTNFNYMFDPYYYFHTSPLYQGMLNTSGLRDEQLMNVALDMRNTTPDDLRAYVEKWLAFQERFGEVVPMVPLYSNIYFDFYRNDLQGYNPITSANWALAVPYAYISDVPLMGEDLLEGVAVDGEATDSPDAPIGGQ